MPTPAVTVVIPAFQVSGYIAATLEAVFAQTFRDIEVVVVNDGSPDTPALRAALAPYRDRIVYLEQENGGPSKARNTAIAAARGEWLAFLDGDDLWAPTFLASQLAYDVLRISGACVLIWLGARSLLRRGKDVPAEAPTRGPVGWRTGLITAAGRNVN